MFCSGSLGAEALHVCPSTHPFPHYVFLPGPSCLLLLSPSLVRRKALVLGPSPTPPQDLQLPLVVAMQERVWGSPHCKVTTARVHQDVELSEKGERKDIAHRLLWTHQPVVLLDLCTEEEQPG